ncbi:alpha/beta hydrolase [Streptomyces spongiicola]|uniref:Alpha/beta hydrolase n=1 Tax=Streptomyces spongiicola TaxID=1690221 RepID=A0ABM6V106_9ACTN|nr:alpha/beta hydrolase [Streptomyces spongiicola]AWK07643.1 alpha/beta hydrolase [Streptomyces spongiicola]
MAIIETAGVRLHVQRLGQADGRGGGRGGGGGGGETVVLLHGLLTDSLASYYFTVAPAFAAAGLDVVMYDQRGHGRSGRPASGYGLGRFTDDLGALLDLLEVPGRVHLVGNSFGGTVSFGYALRHPDRVASVSVVESEPATASWARKIAGLLDRVRHEMTVNESEALDWITAHRGRRTARLARSAGRLVRDTAIAEELTVCDPVTEDALRLLDRPVLAVYGADSDLCEQAPWLGSLLPRSRTVLVPGHEHSVLVEAPGRVRDEVLAWIAEHPATGGPGRRRPGEGRLAVAVPAEVNAP